MELFRTAGPNKAGELAAALCSGGRFDLILAAGGDGTINEAANGIVGSGIAFGALPAGTANVLANEVGLSGRPDRAAVQLLDAEPRRIAVGEIAWPGLPPRRFLLMAGAGLDARIVYELNLGLKAKLGKLAYWHGGFRQLGRPVPRFRIHVNGHEHHASFALLTRVRNYGGDFRIARHVLLTDPDFEIVIFENHQWQDYLRFFAAVVRNTLHTTRGVTIHRASQARLDCAEDNRIYIQTDGEAAGSLPVTVSIMPDALTLLLPKTYA